MKKPDWLNIDISQPPPPVLMLGRIDSSKHVEAHKAKTTKRTQDSLNEIVTRFLALRDDNDFMPYSDTGIVGTDQTFIGNLSKIVRSSPGFEQEATGDVGILVKHIENARHTNDSITLDEFEDHTFTFYMVVARNHAGEDVAYVRRLRGFKLTNNRWHFMSVGNNDALEIFDKPVFKLDLGFDFALRGSDLAVWNVDSFLGLFVDVDALKSALPSYLASIQKGIPAALTSSTMNLITTAAKRSIRIAKQVRRISYLDYLDRVTAPNIQAYLDQTQEISTGISVKEDEVDVEEDSIQHFLKLIEQRFWRGHFDQNLKEAQTFIFPEAP